MDKTKLSEKDVGLIEDMCYLLKNLISIEDHSAMSFAINQENKWLELLELIRKMRTKWLGLIVKKEESHLWCISKHILASAEGMLEVGNRFLSTKQNDTAKEAFDDAAKLLSLFMILNNIGKEGVEVESSA